jgi:hypothetical protein
MKGNPTHEKQQSYRGFHGRLSGDGSRLGFRRSELDKLLHVLVVTRADLSARSSMNRHETKYAARLRPDRA